MANESESTFVKDSYFKIDPEAHLMGDLAPIEHFPGVQMWWRGVDGCKRALFDRVPSRYTQGLESHEKKKNLDPEALIGAMDKYGVDIACLLPESMMDTTGYSSRWASNGEMAKVVDANPDRFIYQPNISPIKRRGVKNAIWELEYWVKERGAKIFKYYSPEDTYINDPELWPFYEKAQELKIVLDMHTGFVWVPPGKSKYCAPVLLDDVARDFPELSLVAFHMGYPYPDELNMVAMGHQNVNVCLSLLVPWALWAPRKFAKLLGEALVFAGPDKVIWGTDYAGFPMQVKFAVEGLRDFQIPEDLREAYGYPEITEEIRRKIFGENLAGLLGIDAGKRRVSV
jgi:predicted TIM-barrel fold metal-dependent hydrolase